jgi:hypothetical protein
MTISKRSKKVRIKKVGGIAAILFTCGSFGSVVLADCDLNRESAAYEAEALARYVRCVDYPVGLTGTWDPGNPIWQFKGKKGPGCEVHYKLSKKLDEEPQKKTTDKGKPNNTNRGAASALRDHKDQAAYDSLQKFIDTIMYDAKLNPNFASNGTGNAAENADVIISDALSIQASVGDLLLYCQ